MSKITLNPMQQPSKFSIFYDGNKSAAINWYFENLRRQLPSCFKKNQVWNEKTFSRFVLMPSKRPLVV